jgi:hypothetical protein
MNWLAKLYPLTPPNPPLEGRAFKLIKPSLRGEGWVGWVQFYKPIHIESNDYISKPISYIYI